MTVSKANERLSENGILQFFQVSGRPVGSGSELQRFFKKMRETHEDFLFTSKTSNRTGRH